MRKKIFLFTILFVFAKTALYLQPSGALIAIPPTTNDAGIMVNWIAGILVAGLLSIVFWVLHAVLVGLKQSNDFLAEQNKLLREEIKGQREDIVALKTAIIDLTGDLKELQRSAFYDLKKRQENDRT